MTAIGVMVGLSLILQCLNWLRLGRLTRAIEQRTEAAVAQAAVAEPIGPRAALRAYSRGVR